MMAFFRKQLTTYYFHKKVLSQIFKIVANAEAVGQRCFVNKVVLQISGNAQERTCHRGLLKKRLQHRCFPVNFEKFLRTTFLYKTSGGCFCQYTSELLKQHLILQYRRQYLDLLARRNQLDFNIDAGLAPHWLSCSEVQFTTIIFYYVGQTPSEVQWEKRKMKISRT